MNGSRKTTDARAKRNQLIKAEIEAMLRKDYSLKEALYAAADKWFLTMKHVQRIYYDTRSQ